MPENMSKDVLKNFKEVSFIQNKIKLDKPIFMQEEIKFTKAQIGTLTHLMFQKIDFNKIYTLETLTKEIDSYVDKQIITKEERKVIDVNKIYTFVISEFANRIRNAKKICKEAPFYMEIGVDKISIEAKEKNLTEKVLVQGIIDLYFEEDDGQLVLLDYKTDYIKKGEEANLIEKHKGQLMIYKKALENATRKKVKEVYLYATELENGIIKL